MRRRTDFPARSDVLPKLDALIHALSRPVTRQERRAGWSEESRVTMLEYFTGAKTRLLDPRPLQPEEFPPEWVALRGLDAWGIDIGSESALRERALDIAGDLRRVLAGELRRARPESPAASSS